MTALGGGEVRATWSMVIVGLLTAIAGATSYSVFSTQFATPPVQPLKAHVINSPVKTGTQVTIEYLTQRNRLCRSDADIYFIRQPERRVVWRTRTPAVSIPLGTSSAQVDYPHPVLPPGQYIMREFIYSDCGGGEYSAVQAPDAPFEVIP